ncbi:hypothetical protein [Nocardiopsis dassonvillei]|uniref:hypothetical protein n=1 Tax=Nocardiopsis dassonvillei TaxID=2014 RepID=UPI003F571C28
MTPDGPRPKNAVLYCRASDDRDKNKRSVSAQETDAHTRAVYLGWELGPRETHVIIKNSVSAFKRKKVKQQFGRRWRDSTPLQLRWMLDNGHDLDTAYGLVRVLTAERIAMSAEEARTVRDSGQDTLPARRSDTRRDRVTRTREILSGPEDGGRLSAMSAGDLDRHVAEELGVSLKSASRYRRDAAEGAV